MIGQHEQQLLAFALPGFSWGHLPKTCHLQLLQGCPFLCIHAAPSATGMAGKASVGQGHIAALLKSDQFGGNVNRNVNAFFTEQIVSTWERHPQRVVLLWKMCCFTAAKVIALSWYPLLPAQEHSSAGVQPGVCMANMQKPRKGSEGTVGPDLAEHHTSFFLCEEGLLSCRETTSCACRETCVTSSAMGERDILYSSGAFHTRGVQSAFKTIFIVLRKG